MTVATSTASDPLVAPGSTPAVVAANRPKVASYDVFDTLIARRCIDPQRIFEQVAERSGRANFAAARIQAEALVASQPYGLATIYSALALILGLDADETIALEDLEKTIEIENCIAIEENLRAVADGDLLISDMYLDPDLIAAMLKKAGLEKTISLIVTSDGKKTGVIWPEVARQFDIVNHHGDNPHSDIAVPNTFGIRTRHTDASAPNAVETVFLDIGLRDLAEVCRETRLASWSDDASLRALQLVQTSFNFPLMLLASVALARYVAAHSIGAVLFSSRDCNLWRPLFEHIACSLGITVSSEYFYTSRMVRTNPSEDYIDYARSKFNDGTLVVDICGTGWSLSHLFEKVGTEGHIYLLQHLPPAALYETVAPTPLGARIASLLDGGDPRLSNETLEMCNYAEHGMVRDVRMIGRFPAPVFRSEPRSDFIVEAIATQRRCFDHATRILKNRSLDQIQTLSDQSLEALCRELYAGLSNQAIVRQIFQQQHFAEDVSVLSALGCI